MKKNVLIIALCMAIVVLFASCNSFTIENAAYGTFSGKAIEDFEITIESFELIGYAGGGHLVGMKEWKGTKLINDAIQAKIDELGGKAAINVEIKQNVTAIQAILCAVTQRIYCPETIVITGTVIK